MTIQLLKAQSTLEKAVSTLLKWMPAVDPQDEPEPKQGGMQIRHIPEELAPGDPAEQRRQALPQGFAYCRGCGSVKGSQDICSSCGQGAGRSEFTSSRGREGRVRGATKQHQTHVLTPKRTDVGRPKSRRSSG